MMFASKTPRDLNHDPLPHAWYSPNGFFSGRSVGPYRAAVGDSPGWRSEHAPRPEFDHVQHNAPNPILVAVRKDTGATYESAPESVEAYLEHICERSAIRTANAGLGVWRPAHIEHARKVLQRLASLTNDKEN